MSEEQVLPPEEELDKLTSHCGYLQAELNAVLAREYATTVRYDARIDKLEAERERLQEELSEVVEKNREFAINCRKMGDLVDEACDAGEKAEAELARERELHQGLRERMKQAAALLEKDSTYFRSHREAIALLNQDHTEDKSKPVATT